MAIVPIFAAELNLSDLVARAEAGEEIILTWEGRAVAKIVPISKPLPKLEDAFEWSLGRYSRTYSDLGR